MSYNKEATITTDFEITIRQKVHSVTDKIFTAANVYDEGLRYIKSKFEEVNTKPREIFTHFLCETDSGFELVFNSMRDIMLRSLLSK